DASLQRLVSAVARVLAAAIESAQLGGSAAIQDRQRQALKDVSTALASKTDLPTILDQIVVGITRSLNLASMIMMLDLREDKFRLAAQSGLDTQISQRLFHDNISISDLCIVGQTLQRRQPYVSQDITRDERFPLDHELFSELGLRSIFSYPLVTGTTVYGALLLCDPEPRGFTPLKADILSLFANQATVAIHNGMLLESVQQRNRFQEAIEQLELAHKRHPSGPLYADSTEKSEHTREEEQIHELELFKQVCEETQRSFGVSFSSLLRFISENLLTQSERDLQAIVHARQNQQALELVAANNVDTQSSVQQDLPRQDHPASFAETALLLAQTAEDAVVRAGMLGELGRLMMQLKQSNSSVKD